MMILIKIIYQNHSRQSKLCYHSILLWSHKKVYQEVLKYLIQHHHFAVPVHSQDRSNKVSPLCLFHSEEFPKSFMTNCEFCLFKISLKISTFQFTFYLYQLIARLIILFHLWNFEILFLPSTFSSNFLFFLIFYPIIFLCLFLLTSFKPYFLILLLSRFKIL